METASVPCPVCNRLLPQDQVVVHAATCQGRPPPPSPRSTRTLQPEPKNDAPLSPPRSPASNPRDVPLSPTAARVGEAKMFLGQMFAQLKAEALQKLQEIEKAVQEESNRSQPPPPLVECPLCFKKFPQDRIAAHASSCNGLSLAEQASVAPILTPTNDKPSTPTVQLIDFGDDGATTYFSTLHPAPGGMASPRFPVVPRVVPPPPTSSGGDHSAASAGPPEHGGSETGSDSDYDPYGEEQQCLMCGKALAPNAISSHAKECGNDTQQQAYTAKAPAPGQSARATPAYMHVGGAGTFMPASSLPTPQDGKELDFQAIKQHFKVKFDDLAARGKVKGAIVINRAGITSNPDELEAQLMEKMSQVKVGFKNKWQAFTDYADRLAAEAAGSADELPKTPPRTQPRERSTSLATAAKTPEPAKDEEASLIQTLPADCLPPSNDDIMAALLRQEVDPRIFFKVLPSVALVMRTKAKEAKTRVSDQRAGSRPVTPVRSPVPDRKTRSEIIVEGKRRLQARLVPLCLKEIVMKDDGNCQWRAIAYQLYGDPELHFAVRKKVVGYMVAHKDLFSIYFDGAREYDTYCKQMSKNKVWGDELTIKAACEAFDTTVHVIASTETNWYLKYSPENGSAEAKPAKKAIFVSYISPVHYNVVVLDEKRYAHIKHIGCDGSCLNKAPEPTPTNQSAEQEPATGNLMVLDDDETGERLATHKYPTLREMEEAKAPRTPPPLPPRRPETLRPPNT